MMTKTKRILIAEKIERAVKLNLINKGDQMTTQEIRKQINLQKMHNARTKRAEKNLVENEKLLAKYGGMYTQAEINLMHDLHPYLRGMTDRPLPVAKDRPNEKEIVKLLDQLGMYAKCVQEDNHFMV